MANEITVGANLPPALAALFQDDLDDELSGGVSVGFGVVSIRGSKFRIGYKGEESLVLNAEGEPQGYMDAVIIRGSSALQKIYYEKKYSEGDDAAPDCFSMDGVKPDASVSNPQSSLCANCKWAAWGSRITESGEKRKACQDARRVALVPAQDLRNEAYGGPMLLRIPAASLQALSAYNKKLKEAGYPFFGVITRIGFDPDVAYPKLTFKPTGVINTEEDAEIIREYRVSDEVNRILVGTHDLSVAAPEPAAAPSDMFIEPAPKAEPEPAPKPKAKKAKKEEPVAKAEPPETNEEAEEADEETNEALQKLLSGLS